MRIFMSSHQWASSCCLSKCYEQKSCIVLYSRLGTNPASNIQSCLVECLPQVRAKSATSGSGPFVSTVVCEVRMCMCLCRFGLVGIPEIPLSVVRPCTEHVHIQWDTNQIWKPLAARIMFPMQSIDMSCPCSSLELRSLSSWQYIYLQQQLQKMTKSWYTNALSNATWVRLS